MNSSQISRREALATLATGAGSLALATFSSVDVLRAAEPVKGLLPGELFPDFKLPNVKGEQIQFSEATKGKLVLVEFWATWCGACIRDIPKVHELVSMFGAKSFVDPAGNAAIGKGFTTFSVAVNQDKDEQKEWRDMHSSGKIKGEQHVETAKIEVMVNRFGTTSFPHYFLLNGERRVISPKISLDAVNAFATKYQAG